MVQKIGNQLPSGNWTTSSQERFQDRKPSWSRPEKVYKFEDLHFCSFIFESDI